jgi:hypothetical protein
MENPHPLDLVPPVAEEGEEEEVQRECFDTLPLFVLSNILARAPALSSKRPYPTP